jgi:phthalate 4,5-dioxygenase
MLTSTENELLTRVGKGTPLGEMMRRYWHPIALSEQVAEPDGTPLRTKLLGERFVVFRDTEGKVGVLDEMCMHRGVSLALGRNEEGGLRCVYHGWKFAVDGTILETPNHADCRYRERMKAPAYPVVEQSGLIWTYIGPQENVPPFREFVYDTVPATNRAVNRANVPASWLPLWEGGLDSSHVAILHTNMVRPNWVAKAKAKAEKGEVPPLEAISFDHLAPGFEIEDTWFGYHYCAFRDVPGKPDMLHARLVPAIMPYGRIIPKGTRAGGFCFEVPLDDFETSIIHVSYDLDNAVDGEAMKVMLGYNHKDYNPETYTFEMNWDDRLGQDRASMATNWTGYRGIEVEDIAMSSSVPQDWNRSKEHLVASDVAVVKMRRMVLAAIEEFQRSGKVPAGDIADMVPVRACDTLMPREADWQALASGNRELVPAK